VQGHPDGYRGERVPEAEDQVQRQWAEVRLEPNAWDAWDGARPDAVADAAHRLPELVAEDAGKLAGPAQDVPARVAWCLPQPGQRVLLDVAAVLCRLDEVRSGEQSFSARAAQAALQTPAVQRVSEQPARVALKRRPRARAAVAAARPLVPEAQEESRDAAVAERVWLQEQVVQVFLRKR
jgi:hypothetical protein